ncbi:MBL fold metallo-hydrolase [Streptomyces sp. RY43-2]|uniref:MBL fold metallo-hydrolase n=1 Tax=Streptomyces macrolidinus TaxID=2952607 RepID=A0ABT0Z9A8_9ACTN|nr:MBL fold metallo-hydrolase [Streptomyces macrolidinus]MCN9240355.1 MBL fold metallo-hydrolase [Streptomyces macrolidinus]
MDVIPLLPRLHLLRFVVGQACLWCDDDELTLVDAGVKGSGAPIAEAIRALGLDVSQLRRIVLTHFHEDHMGGAAELAALSGAEVLAHRLDAPVVLGQLPAPPPVFEEGERAVQAAVARRLPRGEPLRPDRVGSVEDGDVLDFGGGARVVHAPGHTHGSIALHLPEHGVLFTGDAVAVSPADGAVILGVFNLDRAQAIRSFRQLAALDTEVACFGHGEPVLENAADVLRRAADTY